MDEGIKTFRDRIFYDDYAFTKPPGEYKTIKEVQARMRELRGCVYSREGMEEYRSLARVLGFHAERSAKAEQLAHVEALRPEQV